MTCLRCNDQRVVWSLGEFGQAVCGPCPDCNRNGIAVKKEQARLDRELEEMKQELLDQERLAANG